MTTPAASSLDDFLNPQYRLIVNRKWLKRWETVFRVLAILALAVNAYYINNDLVEANYRLLRRVMFVGVICAGATLAGTLLGLLLGFLPLKQFGYTQKLRLTVFAGIGLSNAVLIFMLLADL